MTWELSFAGLFVGVLVGITGMGGGSLITPILVLIFGLNPSVAVGTDIAHGAIFKTFGGLRHRALGNGQARLSGWMFLGSAPMSLLGVALATWLTHRYGDGVQSLVELSDLSSLVVPDLYSPAPLAQIESIIDPVSLAGPCFAPDGRTLFVNIQGDALTLAIRWPFTALESGARDRGVDGQDPKQGFFGLGTGLAVIALAALARRRRGE